jgi:hypothetical protein
MSSLKGLIENDGAEREIWSTKNDMYHCNQDEEKNPMG